MRVNSMAWKNALNHRSFFTSEFLKFHGPTDSLAGASLVENARIFGYSERERAVPGSTLRKWMRGEGAPQWAVKTMVRYVLLKGYVPDTDNELDALVVYLLIDSAAKEAKGILTKLNLVNLDNDEVEKAISRIWHAKSDGEK